jgi:hypothetical protein
LTSRTRVREPSCLPLVPARPAGVISALAPRGL